jgi:hypothetical protein
LKSVRVVVATAVLAALTISGTGAGAAISDQARSPRIMGFSGCGKVNDEGGRSPVKAAVIACEKARAIGKDFIKNDVLKKRWKSFNPAGCEFFLYRKADQGLFDTWYDQGGTPTFKLIYLVRLRGCES